MSLSDLASLGNFVSGVAVVTTLIFLLLQMRQNNRNQRSIIQQARSERNMAITRQVASRHFSEVQEKLYQRKALTVAEINIYVQTTAGVFHSWEDSFLQFRGGTLDATSWQAEQEIVSHALQDPARRAAWQLLGPYFTGPYRAFIDDLILRTNVPILADFSVEALWNAALEKELARGHAAAAPSTS